MTIPSISAEELRQIEDYLKGYLFYQKLLRLDRYEKQYFYTQASEWETEAPGELSLARAKMFEIRHAIMALPNSEEKLLLYYHYIKGEPVEKCAELLGISRSSAFRMKKRALTEAALTIGRDRAARAAEEQKNDRRRA